MTRCRNVHPVHGRCVLNAEPGHSVHTNHASLHNVTRQPRWYSSDGYEPSQSDEVCISCRQPIERGQEWCQTPDCLTDLRDSNNLVKEGYSNGT